MLLTVKDLAAQLQIKPSTLYAWATQGKIPCCRIHGLVRFDAEAVQTWLRSFAVAPPRPVPRSLAKPDLLGVDDLIARAKRVAYNPAHGETRPTASPSGKEDGDGAR